MIRIFLDATVIFSASLSKTGASRELFRLAKLGRVELVTNKIAVMEAGHNLAKKSPEGLIIFQVLIKTSIIKIFENPTKSEIEVAAMYTALKDAPIVAGAINTQANYLATFDRKHLINPPEVSKNSNVIIATAGDILDLVKEQDFD